MALAHSVATDPASIKSTSSLSLSRFFRSDNNQTICRTAPAPRHSTQRAVDLRYRRRTALISVTGQIDAPDASFLL